MRTETNTRTKSSSRASALGRTPRSVVSTVVSQWDVGSQRGSRCSPLLRAALVNNAQTSQTASFLVFGGSPAYSPILVPTCCLGKCLSEYRRVANVSIAMVGLGRATTRVATLVIVTASPDWMAEHFEILQHRTLLEITLPGSHNSGNYQGGLHADLLHVIIGGFGWVSTEHRASAAKSERCGRDGTGKSRGCKVGRV